MTVVDDIIKYYDNAIEGQEARLRALDSLPDKYTSKEDFDKCYKNIEDFKEIKDFLVELKMYLEWGNKIRSEYEKVKQENKQRSSDGEWHPILISDGMEYGLRQALEWLDEIMEEYDHGTVAQAISKGTFFEQLKNNIKEEK